MRSAVEKGDAKELAELMRQDPGFKVNVDRDGNGWTVLHCACHDDSRSAMIPLLLAHPDIDVNVKNRGDTPFIWACFHGNTPCVRLLRKDSRVDVNEPNFGGSTPLKFTAKYAHSGIIGWWIASGREIDLGTPGNDRTDAIRVAKEYGKKGVVTLLERFKENPVETRHRVRLELGLVDELAAEMFALVVFVSDGLLQIRDTASSPPAARFFSIARRLPLELQMVLCYHVVGSDKEIIPGKDSEVAFKKLARRLW